MAIETQEYHEFDPEIDYEIITKPIPVYPDAVDCCQCVGGDQTLCSSETSFGAFATSAAAQTFAYWYS